MPRDEVRAGMPGHSTERRVMGRVCNVGLT